MQGIKGKTVSILLLFCLIAPTVSTFTFLHYQRKRIRKEVKHQIISGLDKSELVLLKFTKKESETELKWKHSKEFEYNDQMYDIVETEIKSDTIYYWCWWDNKETKLNKQLDKLLDYAHGNDPKQKESQKRLANFYKLLYCEEHSHWYPFTFQAEQQLFVYEFSYLTISLPPPVPPPEIG